MVAYRPPDDVILMIGASHRSGPLIEAALRIKPIAAKDRAVLVPFGFAQDFDEEIGEHVADIERYLRDAMVKKNDTSLQMAEVAETMMRIRGWLIELRELAVLHLSLDAPALMRLCSPAPEIADAYARDLLDELEKRVQAASDVRARLEDVGVDDRFVGRGKKLAHQLRTAIGREDLDPKNLQLKLRRHYVRKGTLHTLLKRIVRAGRYAFRADPQKARGYHLRELEPPELLRGA